MEEETRDCAHGTMKTVSSMRMCAEILGETVIDKLKLFRVILGSGIANFEGKRCV